MDRTRSVKLFNDHVATETKKTVEDLILKGEKSEEEFKEDLDVLSYSFSKYFWTLRVDVKVNDKSMVGNDVYYSHYRKSLREEQKRSSRGNRWLAT